MFQVAELDPRSMSPDQWAALHAFRRKRHAEVDPNDPLDPDEIYENDLKHEDKLQWHARFVAVTIERRVIGYAVAWAPTPDAPWFKGNEHLVDVMGSVLESERGKGVAKALIAAVVEKMQSLEKTTATFWVTEDSGRAFLAGLGATTGMNESLSRLDLATIDWAKMDAWIEEGVKRSPNTTIEIIQDRLPDELLKEYSPVYTMIHNDMPLEELKVGDEVFTPERFRDIKGWLDAIGAHHHTCLTREADGSISALTDVVYKPALPEHLSQWATGVVPAYRGRGLGKLVKAKMLRFLATRHPQIRWIDTENAGSNAAMLAINRAMGFAEYRKQTAMQATVEQLAAKAWDR